MKESSNKSCSRSCKHSVWTIGLAAILTTIGVWVGVYLMLSDTPLPELFTHSFGAIIVIEVLLLAGIITKDAISKSN